MGFEEVKEKLHDFIEHGSQSKVMAIYMLLNDDLNGGNVVYDEETLNMLEARRDEIVSGKVKTYTLEETIENLRKYRNQHDV